MSWLGSAARRLIGRGEEQQKELEKKEETRQRYVEANKELDGILLQIKHINAVVEKKNAAIEAASKSFPPAKLLEEGIEESEYEAEPFRKPNPSHSG